MLSLRQNKYHPRRQRPSDAQPDYLALRKTDSELSKRDKPNILKPTGKNIILSAVLAAVLTAIENEVFRDSSPKYKALRIILILIMSYMTSFLASTKSTPEQEIEKFSRNPASRNGQCSNCGKQIAKVS